MRSPGWPRLLEGARAEVRSVLRGLPAPLREQAKPLPVTYERRPGPGLIDDGIAEDTLGLFVGEALAETGLTLAPLPAQIILFLENIWEIAEGDEAEYRAEVRTTYLHELGHYLGLDESDLEERGLE